MDDKLESVKEEEVASVAILINKAFGARRWENDPPFLTGSRVMQFSLLKELEAQPDGTLLQWKRGDDSLVACVFLKSTNENRSSWYMGYFCMDPNQQGVGMGVKMLAMAEAWAKRKGAKEISIKVVNIRKPLISWYIRRGYLIGEDEPFPYHDFESNAMLFNDLRLVNLSKTLS